MNRVVITGPTGAIGIALINELIKHNVEVIAVCRAGSNRTKNIPTHPLIRVIECSLDNLINLSKMVDMPCDVFYHFGWDGTFGADARNNMPGQVSNIQYTLDAVKAAKSLGCKKFIGAGSQAEYGRVEGKLSADTPAFPENGYGMAKLCAGNMSRIMCEQYGMDHVWTRILSIYGPYDGKHTMIMSTIDKLLRGEVPQLTKGEQMWDYLYSTDVGSAMYLIGEKGVHGKVYPIGSGRMYPLIDYIKQLRDEINPELELGIGMIPYGPKQVMHLCADISELEQDTGFTPQYSFEKGISETIEWYKNNYYEEN